MKVSIYDEKPEEKEQEFLLRLVYRRNYIDLVMVDSDGDEVQAGILLSITKDMRFKRQVCVNSGLGLPLNKDGQLELHEEEDDF